MIEKECNRCFIFKDKTNFSKDSTRIEGVRDECKSCLNAIRKIHRDNKTPEQKQANAAYRKQYYSDKRNGVIRPKREKRYCPNEARLKRKYGITTEQYKAFVNLQKGKCSVCEKEPISYRKKLYVDHSHQTGKVRGLVCLHCNSLLGFAKDSIEILKQALNYLEERKDGWNQLYKED